jgi:hypothetical protein
VLYLYSYRPRTETSLQKQAEHEKVLTSLFAGCSRHESAVSKSSHIRYSRMHMHGFLIVDLCYNEYQNISSMTMPPPRKSS